jgi:hypothetical protein
LLLPFTTSEHEVELAVRLGIPVFGADPALAWLGTKQGSRGVFADEGVTHPLGYAAPTTLWMPWTSCGRNVPI